MLDHSKSSFVQADGSLGGALIRQDTFVCNRVYNDDVSFTELYSHRSIEISMVVGGSGIHRVLGQAIPCKAGDIYILNSGIPHRYFTAEEGESLTVRRLLFDPREWFDGDVMQPTSSNFCYGVFSENAMSAYAMLTQSVLEKIMSLCDSIAIELLEKKSEWRAAVKANLSLVMITLGRYVNRSIKNIPNADSAEWNSISAVLAVVKENYGDTNMTLESIADSFYVSKSHLSRLFRQVTGEGFSDYLRKVRLSGACVLLSDTDLTIEEIIKKCGMRDATTFYKAFGEYIGMTPNNYRKVNRNSQDGEREPSSILSDISAALQKGKAKIVSGLIQQAIDNGIEPNRIINDALLDGMGIVGNKFKNSEIYVPEVLVAARAMNVGMQMLKPYLAENGVSAIGTVCIGTVQGDLHDIGKNLVRMMLEGKGLDVIDLGTDVPPETFISTAIEHNCQVICCSALLTTTVDVIGDIVKAAENAGIRDKVKIMVGGAPVSEEICRQLGADVYTSDAASAADAAVELCKSAKC